MQKFFLTVVLIFLAGCSATLPDRSAEVEDFVPAELVEKVAEDVGTWTFFAENFPDECEWFDLERVIDGDTIRLTDGTSVRFVGIDTPETVHPRKPVQWCGPEASAWTKNMFKNVDRVCVIADEKNDSLDRYGWRLGYPFTPEGADVCAELVERGLARGYFRYPMEREEEFRALQKSAQDAARGIWSKNSDTPDCEFQSNG